MKPRLCAAAALLALLAPALARPAQKTLPPRAAKPPLAREAALPPLPSGIRKLAAAKQYEKLLQALRRGKADLGGRRSFLSGHAHLRLRRFARAVAPLRRARREIPALESYALLFLAEAALGAGDDALARRALEELIEKGKRAPNPAFVHSSLVRVHRKEERPLRAAKVAERFVRLFPDAPEAPDFLLRQAEALRAAGRGREAARAFWRLWRRHPERPGAGRARKRAEALAAAFSPPLPGPGAKAHYERARLLRKRFYFEKALGGFQEFRRLFPKAPYHARLAFQEALTLFSLRETKRAGPALAHAISHHPPGSARRAEARYYLARNHLRARSRPAFEAEARRLLREKPRGKWAARARYLLGRVHEDDRRFAGAARYYEEIISRHPRSPLAPKALFRLGWLDFQRKDYRRARRGFSRMIAAHPGHWLAASARYWAAAAAERTGERKRALAGYRACVRLHRHRYYGQQALRALRRLGREGDIAAVPPPGEAGYREWMRPPPGAAARARTAALLASMGLHEHAAREYHRLGAGRYFRYRAARAFTEAGESHRAILLINKSFWDAARSGGSDLPEEFWRIVYPLVVRKKEPGGADVHLVNAVIRAESAFDPRAISPAGARGLMQLMPATGRRLARRHGTRVASADDFFDPEINARLGARHLGALVREFGGALAPAIASYNAGRGAVRRWWKAGRGKPTERFIEEIPYEETKNYVKRVLGYYREYRRIYGAANRPDRRGKSPS